MAWACFVFYSFEWQKPFARSCFWPTAVFEPPGSCRIADRKIEQLDAILVSHDHRDHADKATIKRLTRKFQNAKILAGLGMEDLMNGWKTPKNEVETAGWYQEFSAFDNLKIALVPVRHWSRRSLNDTNKRLWGGFVIQSSNITIYFSGDTGYGGHFKELAEIFPKIDYFIVGIGSYSPQFVMKEIHQTPEEALQGFLDSGAKHLIPMHYGTFDLTNEPPSEPLRLLNQKAEKLGVSDEIKVLKINESVVLRPYEVEMEANQLPNTLENLHSNENPPKKERETAL